MAAVHFTTIRIPFEPNTVCRVQRKPHFCSICSCAIEIVYAGFEVLERSCTFFERFLRFRARRIMSKYTNILHIRLSLYNNLSLDSFAHCCQTGYLQNHVCEFQFFFSFQSYSLFFTGGGNNFSFLNIFVYKNKTDTFQKSEAFNE